MNTERKEYTKDKQIEKLEASQEVVFLMKQHIGAPSIPVVKVKDEVHIGTLIAQASGYVSANIMSSVSGIVKRIEKRQDASGHYQEAVVIENDEIIHRIMRHMKIISIHLLLKKR